MRWEPHPNKTIEDAILFVSFLYCAALLLNEELLALPAISTNRLAVYD